MTHSLLCILSLCHTVKASPRNHTHGSEKLLKRESTGKEKQRNAENAEGGEEKNGDNGEQHREGEEPQRERSEGKKETNLTSSCPSCAPSHTSRTPCPEEQRPLEPTGSRLQEGGQGEAGWMEAGIMRIIITGFINFTMHNWIIHHFD